ncbi:MAG: mercury resistance protein [Chloroflexota bacterium]|nr:mercury resistance protein [Chloroflexota bacterium]
MKKIGGYLLAATGLLACPCHLPLTLSVVAAVAGGTSLGAFLLDSTWLLAGVLGAYFVVAVPLGLRLVTRPGWSRAARATY